MSSAYPLARPTGQDKIWQKIDLGPARCFVLPCLGLKCSPRPRKAGIEWCGWHEHRLIVLTEASVRL